MANGELDEDHWLLLHEIRLRGVVDGRRERRRCASRRPASSPACPKGVRLTPAGRDLHSAWARVEPGSELETSVERAYQRFLALNPELIRACNDWQVMPGGAPNDHRDPTYDWAVVDRVDAIDDRVGPVISHLEPRRCPLRRLPPAAARRAPPRRRRRVGMAHFTADRLVPHRVDAAARRPAARARSGALLRAVTSAAARTCAERGEPRCRGPGGHDAVGDEPTVGGRHAEPQRSVPRPPKIERPSDPAGFSGHGIRSAFGIRWRAFVAASEPAAPPQRSVTHTERERARSRSGRSARAYRQTRHRRRPRSEPAARSSPATPGLSTLDCRRGAAHRGLARHDRGRQWTSPRRSRSSSGSWKPARRRCGRCSNTR